MEAPDDHANDNETEELIRVYKARELRMAARKLVIQYWEEMSLTAGREYSWLMLQSDALLASLLEHSNPEFIFLPNSPPSIELLRHLQAMNGPHGYAYYRALLATKNHTGRIF